MTTTSASSRHLHRPVALIAAGLTVLLGLAPAASAAAPPDTVRVSLNSSGGPAVESRSEPFAVSADGRYVAFTSAAPNLAPGDTNETWDVFVHDRRTGRTERISQSSAAAPGDSSSYGQSMTPDGRYVAFTSAAANLVPGDTNEAFDGFLHDRRTGRVSRVTLTGRGGQADARSYAPVLSADARFVAFVSDATDLVPGDTNGVADVFRRDRLTGITVPVSGPGSGAPSDAPVISADGRFVTFTSEAPLVPGDTNGLADVFRRDLRTGDLRRVNVSASGAQADGYTVSPAMSADGGLVAFTSAAALVAGDTNGETDVFLRDLRAGTTVRVSQGTGAAYSPVLSGDGRYVVFTSDAADLTADDTNGVSDVFRHELATGRTTRVSLGAGGSQGNDGSNYGTVSRDGRFVAFASAATNLVPDDTNGVTDTFLRRLPR